MDVTNCRHFYFVGIGGIGMSALAKYFHGKGYDVRGYDATISDLCAEMENMGIDIIYDSANLSEHGTKTNYKDLIADDTTVIFTPAVSEETPVMQYFMKNNFRLFKRSELLGEVTKDKRALCVAGTHGKTTTSSILAHLMHESHLGANAFLGGIAKNYNTNVLTDPESDYVVVEADEFDRSFFHLSPYMSVISAVDADHLDIYGTLQNYREGFLHYAHLVQQALVINQTAIQKGFSVEELKNRLPIYTYGINNETTKCDFHASNIRLQDKKLVFDFHTPSQCMNNFCLQIPIWTNVENSVAALSLAYLNGVTENELRNALQSFKGVKRRFDIHVQNGKIVYIDDYAHHPEEINSALSSVKKLFPHHKMVVIFQPHLYSRTRDFAIDFGRVLSLSDKVILLPIYPAREEPIPGVTSDIIAKEVQTDTAVIPYNEVVDCIKKEVLTSTEPLVVMTVGAGNIANLTEPLSQMIYDCCPD